jgi:hypothetical protein
VFRVIEKIIVENISKTIIAENTTQKSVANRLKYLNQTN